MGEIVTATFRGDHLYGFRAPEGDFVAIKSVCDGMGLPWEPQRKRIQRDPVLSKATSMMEVPFGGSRGQEVTCLKLGRVNFWLATIDSSRIGSDAVRERVILYQEECADALCAYFQGRAANDHTPRLVDEVDLALPVGERRKLVTEARQSFGTSASRALWVKLGLPSVVPMFHPDDHQPELPGLTYRAVPTEDAA